MHPLIGGESRPFQYHPLSDYGCTSCHSGNGQALTANRAHGPLYDGTYEPAPHEKKPQFTEVDFLNDPSFSRMYNSKPGHELIFQTNPLMAGPLLAAKCMECHQTTSGELQSSIDRLSHVVGQKRGGLELLKKEIKKENEALVSLYQLKEQIEARGRDEVMESLVDRMKNEKLTSTAFTALQGNLLFLQEHEESILAIEKAIEELEESSKRAHKHLKDDEEQKTLERLQQDKKALEVTLQDHNWVKHMQGDVDLLIQHYTRGKELFVSQACYACHRIAGYSRASIGPELTKAGQNYPWYIKESIVWPQADLPSSTMPNFRLDHEELSDLMTFLMAQKGGTKAVAEIDYQIGLSQWERGEKMPWENVVSPSAIEEVRSGQIVFVTEGCASCHKLKGFESNVGLHNEEGRRWFQATFPNQIAGSLLASRVELNRDLIDNYIITKSEKEGILEEIERDYPKLIESFYTNFKFASRAFNAAYHSDPDKLDAYKKQLHKVGMIYIQEYGLGRDIAPYLHWSGVYRDKEWLMGHFHNPSAYSARSIMPSLPFDDSKFYMLSNMLHVMGQKNRDTLREVWQKEGFNPAQAYEHLCSACHGEQRQGNGVIAEWIYPIPKNLRDSIFLSILTKEKAADSIKHGVKGTPMPPWGEAVEGSSQPILNAEEIEELVNWLYHNVPYELHFRVKENSKWHYGPTDLLKEMEKENIYLVSEEKVEPSTTDSYFEKKEASYISTGTDLYFIKERYYTPENIQKGKELFMANCASCHGNDGAGGGLRSISMVESKPRMLTNLPWIQSKDDIALLRSIKYGVAGTSMIAWGDQTTATQRMQLVLFIRDLSKLQIWRRELETLLYEVYDSAIQSIEKVRAATCKNLESVTQESLALKLRLNQLIEKGEMPSENLVALYQQNAQLKREHEQAEARNHFYLSLIQLLKHEKQLYFALGTYIIGGNVTENAIQSYFQICRYSHLEISTQQGALHCIENREEKEAATAYTSLLNHLDEKIAYYQREMTSLEEKSETSTFVQRLQTFQTELQSWITLRAKLITQIADAQALRDQQKTLCTQQKLQ